MELHGTSMAAPIVTGTVAAMLEENPSLTPNLNKAILQYSAIPLPKADVLEQGAGTLNVAGAIQMAAALRDDLDKLKPGELMLASGATLTTPSTTIAGKNHDWNGGFYWEWRAVEGDAAFINMMDPWVDSTTFA